MMRMGMDPYLQADETGDTCIGDAQPAPLFKQEEEGLATKKSPPPSFENKKHGQVGVGIGMGMGAGGGKPYPICKQEKKTGQGCHHPRAHGLWHGHGHSGILSLPPSLKQIKKKTGGERALAWAWAWA